jgi:hypothetical protein
MDQSERDFLMYLHLNSKLKLFSFTAFSKSCEGARCIFVDCAVLFLFFMP